MKSIRFIVVFLMLFFLASCSYIKEKKEHWFGGDEDELVEVALTVAESDEVEVVLEEESSETESTSDIEEESSETESTSDIEE